MSHVDELVDLPVGVARDVGEGPALRRPFVESVDREDGEELVDRPRVGQRLEHGEVADERVREHLLHVLELLGDVLQRLQVLVDPLADLPEENLSLRPVLQ